MSEKADVTTEPASVLGRFAVQHSLPIIFIGSALCVAGLYSASLMPSSIFPQTDFPRCVILVDNGVMPADEMMATITRPIEEAMKDVPGAVSVKSATGRGAAEINVFFDWQAEWSRASCTSMAASRRFARVCPRQPALPCGG